MNQITRYLKLYFGIFIIGIISVALFNAIVDPYGIYKILEIQGVNKTKPPFDTQLRMVKLLQVQKFKPKGILLGTSRANYGLDPNHPGWDESSQPVYNLGVNGTNLHEIVRLFQNAQQSNSINQVVMGLDFFVFNLFFSDRIDESIIEILDNRKTPLKSLGKEIKNNLLSTLATKNSFKTLFFKGKPSNLKNGQGIWTDERGIQEITVSTLKTYMQVMWFPTDDFKFCLHNGNGKNDKFDYLKKIIALSEINNIDLRLFISPVHAYLLEAMRVMGLWPIYEQWKRGLVASIPIQEQGNPKKPTVQLWDFSGYNTITTENYPPKNKPQAPMQGYTESAHYKNWVGNQILDRIFDHQNKNRAVPEGFGVQLKNENLEEHLAKIREDQVSYQETHRKEIEKIAQIGKEIRNSENKVPVKKFRSRILCEEMN